MSIKGFVLIMAAMPAAGAAFAQAPPSAPPTSVMTIETFENGVNQGGWTFGFETTLPRSGGNPGGFLRKYELDTYGPFLRTTSKAVFTGDYKARGVSQVGVDLETL